MLIIRGVNVFPTQIEELILKVPQLAPHYLIEVTREGNLDSVAVSVEINPAWCASCAEERQGYAQALQQSVKAYVGISVAVKIHDPGVMERSAGKARHVIDKRPKEALS